MEEPVFLLTGQNLHTLNDNPATLLVRLRLN
jgi:hypothetical protein